MAAAGCAVLALAFALLPSAPSYDAWSWLVWGREILALELDTSGGPSWKPLPALLAAPLSAFGELAPELWLVVVRAAWLGSIVLAYRLAARLAGRRAPAAGPGARSVPRIAGVTAALALLLLLDPQVPWLRHFANGLSEPLLVALVLGAVDRDLDGHPRQALLLGALASLIRPEAWPLLLVYAVRRWRIDRRVRSRITVTATATAVPALWLGGDLLGSGAVSTGGERARVDAVVASPAEAVDRLATVGALAFELPLPAAWLLAAAASWLAWRRGDRVPAVLLGGALAWIGLVAAERLVGYAALARFMLPAAAVACVLGAVRAAWLWEEAWGRRRGPASRAAPRDRVIATVALLVLTLVTAPVVVERAATFDEQLAGAVDRGQEQRELWAAVAAAGGGERLARCGRASVGGFLLAPGLAWRLEVPLHQVAAVGADSRLPGGPVVAFGDGALAARLRQAPEAWPLGFAGRFAIFGTGCDEVGRTTTSAPGAGPRRSPDRRSD